MGIYKYINLKTIFDLYIYISDLELGPSELGKTYIGEVVKKQFFNIFFGLFLIYIR